jgi:hypothetical protein
MNGSLQSTLNKFALPQPYPALVSCTTLLRLRQASPTHPTPTLTQVLAIRSSDAPRSTTAMRCTRPHGRAASRRLHPTTSGTVGSFLSHAIGESVEQRVDVGWAAGGASTTRAGRARLGASLEAMRPPRRPPSRPRRSRGPHGGAPLRTQPTQGCLCSFRGSWASTIVRAY